MASTEDIFNSKYEEFIKDLHDACPEFTQSLVAAFNLSLEERKKQFKEQVIPSCSPTRDPTKCPSYVLPGVCMTEEVWSSLSENSRKAIQEYLTLLSFFSLMESGLPSGFGESSGWSAEWMKGMMEDMKSKMKNVDFSGFAEKMANLFGKGSDGLPQLPEKFLKGQIAKLAEEIVKEIKIEDFGINPADFEEATKDPSKALQMISDIFIKNPQSFQQTILKVVKKLQSKIQSGALRPQELVAEAEELMKTFHENPQFVDMMESLRGMFGMGDDMADLQRATGNDGNARLSLVQARLRKKLEAKKAMKK
jgi:hypothetical protein